MMSNKTDNMQACIDACTKCAQACFECSTECLNEADFNARKNCFGVSEYALEFGNKGQITGFKKASW